MRKLRYVVPVLFIVACSGSITSVDDNKKLATLSPRDSTQLCKDISNYVANELTGQDISRVEKDTERDFIMNSQEAKKYGIIDEVIEKRQPPQVAKAAEGGAS